MLLTAKKGVYSKTFSRNTSSFFIFFLKKAPTQRSLAPAYDITYSPEGSNGPHATPLFYDGNPAKDPVIKAGTRIRIPKATRDAIIAKVETVCSENLPLVIRLK